jgi:hypothetical protein
LSKKVQLRGGFSWTEDSTKYLQNYSVEYDDKKNNIILAAIIRHYLPPGEDEDMLTTYISSLSYKLTDKQFASEAELILGTNPYIKRFEDKNVLIFGARLKENFFINTGLNVLQQIIPLAEAAYYNSNTDNNDFDMQFRAGLTLGFAKNSSVQWRNNYGVVSKVKENERELWRRRFDSEIVVIF